MAGWGVQICRKGKVMFGVRDGTVEGTCVDRLFGKGELDPESETYCGAMELSNSTAEL